MDKVPEFTPKPQEKMSQGKKHNARFNPSTLRNKKENLLNSIIYGKGKSEDIQAKVLELLSLPYELDIRDYTKVIQACNSLQLSSLVMQEVKHRGLSPDVMMFNVYLKKCEEFKDKNCAFAVYKSMVEENVMPDRHTMSILIRSCLAADVPSEAEGLLKKMISHGIDLNSYVFNIVIDYYARKALPLEAFRMRQNMEQYSVAPDEYTISSLMAACYPVAPSKSYLQQLYSDLTKGPLPARAVCTNALFSGIAKAPHLENHFKLKIAVDFHRALSERSYVVGQHAYTSLMSCCAKIGDVEQAKRFLQCMRRDGVEPNQYILTAFIATCSKAKNYQDALTMFDFMRSAPNTPQDCKRPNRYTYEALILAAGNTGRLDDAFTIFDDMLQDGCRPDASSYAKLVLACGLCGDLRRGVRTIEAFQRTGIPKSSFFYHAMIDLFSRCGPLDRAVAVLNEVRAADGVEASHYHYEPIVKLLAERNQWEDVDRFLAAWGDVSYSTYLFLIMDCYKRGLYDKVVQFEQRMERAGQKPYASLMPLLEDARKKAEGGAVDACQGQHMNWNDLNFELDFDLDSNNSLF